MTRKDAVLSDLSVLSASDRAAAEREAWVRRQLAAAPEPSPALIKSLNALRATPDGVGRDRIVADPLPESA